MGGGGVSVPRDSVDVTVCAHKCMCMCVCMLIFFFFTFCVYVCARTRIENSLSVECWVRLAQEAAMIVVTCGSRRAPIDVRSISRRGGRRRGGDCMQTRSRLRHFLKKL